MSKDFPVKKPSRYEELLRQATKSRPITTFNSPEGRKGVYPLDGNVVRVFLVAEVERKRREMAGQKPDDFLER